MTFRQLKDYLESFSLQGNDKLLDGEVVFLESYDDGIMWYPDIHIAKTTIRDKQGSSIKTGELFFQ